jgi:hypothetical protein
LFESTFKILNPSCPDYPIRGNCRLDKAPTKIQPGLSARERYPLEYDRRNARHPVLGNPREVRAAKNELKPDTATQEKAKRINNMVNFRQTLTVYPREKSAASDSASEISV